ncbi:hypothetical protein RRG08_006112 [Elysia crispata]|uniref:Uncharacterized protein n=1 Tax=Elysia crispata TaxID=231223 RepID=A0AAE1D0Q5_9GAST|nr:hypothetical protein RRG08_006112 [Elysia crispata]
MVNRHWEKLRLAVQPTNTSGTSGSHYNLHIMVETQANNPPTDTGRSSESQYNLHTSFQPTDTGRSLD